MDDDIYNATASEKIRELCYEKDNLQNAYAHLEKEKDIILGREVSLTTQVRKQEEKILQLQDTVDTIPKIQESLSNALAENVQLPGLRTQLEQKTTQISGMLTAAEERTSEIQQLRRDLDNANAKMIEIKENADANSISLTDQINVLKNHAEEKDNEIKSLKARIALMKDESSKLIDEKEKGIVDLI